MNTTGEGRRLQEGDVVYFCDLHLDTARRVSVRPIYRDFHVYEVRGKPRPMLILYEIGENEGRAKFFRVLKLSTKISEFKKKLGYRRIGPILDKRDSYADRTPYCLPENSIEGCAEKRIDRLELMLLYRTIGATLGPPPRE